MQVQVLNYTMDQILLAYNESEIGENMSESELACLTDMWLNNQDEDTEDLYCRAVWDEFYCWPFTPAGETITRPCSLVFREPYPYFSEKLEGNAVRVCLKNGTWLDGDRTDYTECARSLMNFDDDYETTSTNQQLVEITKYTVFIGSIVSFIFLGFVLGIFCSFRRVWNQRVKIHLNLMLALLIRSVVLIVVTKPFTIMQTSSHHDNGVYCKIILIAHLHSTVTFVSWVLIQGMYLNERLTNVFAQISTRKFRFYYTFGWGVPVIMVMIYLAAMIHNHPSEDCWQGYSEMNEIQILLIPTILALVINGFFWCNILRIILQRRRSLSRNTETSRVVSIAKATLMLSPIMGLNNLVFIYNPGGEYEKVYIALNTFFGSTQGVFVAIIYWFNCTELHEAIQRSIVRFVAQRNFQCNNKRDEGNDEMEMSTVLKNSQQLSSNEVDANV